MEEKNKTKHKNKNRSYSSDYLVAGLAHSASMLSSGYSLNKSGLG